ncbi:hypothetical protein [Streptomyces sp. MI02-7b]|uniref:hypothetical protein n=1 Tax=Streptomyces sp. MI02-7b TaxID=462941 RepID=UPI0029A467A8|nr:hypothetical protein [Streptomyces sp. MI02-7b]MDX3078369.1 hypothetical protein [Streptomyces sp. MI02-7b]
MSTRTQPAPRHFEAIADRFFESRHLAAARHVIDVIGGEHNLRLAFVSGSLAAGLGHGMSDVDLYVAPKPGHQVDNSGHLVDGVIVHVAPMTEAVVDLIARTSREYVAGRRVRSQIELSDNDLLWSVRYAIGAVLVDDGLDLPDPAQAKLTLRRVIMARSAAKVSGCAEDALGALQVADALTALQASQMALENALECVFAGIGDLYLGRKFLPRRIARAAALRDIAPQIWDQLWLDPSGGMPAVNALVERRLRLSVYLAGVAQLDGWDEPIGHVRPVGDHEHLGGPLRSPWIVPLRLATEWGMAGPDCGFATKAGMIRLWLELDGRPLDRLHRELATHPAFAGTPQDLLTTAVSRLVQKNVATA